MKLVDISKYKKPDIKAMNRKAIMVMAINAVFTVVVAVSCHYTYSGAQLGKKACFELGSNAGSVLFWNIGTLEKIGFQQTCKEYAIDTNLSKADYFEVVNALRTYGYLEK